MALERLQHTPVAASQILTVRSSEADATCRESCEKATELTQLLWPSSVCSTRPSLRPRS